jgi:hypothetical protein
MGRPGGSVCRLTSTSCRSPSALDSSYLRGMDLGRSAGTTQIFTNQREACNSLIYAVPDHSISSTLTPAEPRMVGWSTIYSNSQNQFGPIFTINKSYINPKSTPY